MTAEEAFRLGFLARCAEEGLPESAITQRMKAAEARLSKSASWLDAGKVMMQFGLPVAAGAGTYLAADQLTRPQVDPQEVKNQELINELRRYTRKVMDQNKLKKLREVHSSVRSI